MIRKIVLYSLVLFSSFSFGQNLKKILYKAFSSQDSSNYFYSEAKKLIKTEADEAEYFFSKNARYCDFNVPDSSLYYGQKALVKFKKLNNINYQYYVLNNLAKVYRAQGQYDKAIQNSLIGLKLAETNNSEIWKIYYCISIANNYHDFENYAKGVQYGMKAYNFASKAKEKDKGLICNALNVIAINYDDWKKPQKALYYHYQILKIAKGKLDFEITSTYNNIGNTLLKMGKFEQANTWFQKSVAALKIKYQNSPKDEVYFYEMATVYTNLATVASKRNLLKDAEKLFETAEIYCKKSNSAEKLRDFYKEKYIFNKKTNDLQATLDNQEKYIQLRDSVFKLERTKAIAEIETKYQTEKRQKELVIAKNNILEKEKQNRTKTYGLFFAGFLLLASCSIGFLFYRQQKIKNQQQQQEFSLKEAISKIETQNQLQEQRLLISRDLHDNIGAQLTFIISSVENLKFGFPNIDEKISTHLTKISSFTKDTIIELRDTIWAMNATDISIDDLRTRLHNFIEKAQTATQTASFSFEIDENIEKQQITSLQGINIYRVIQEAVNNAIKHSHADKIEIKAFAKNNQLFFEIIDNGKGFQENNVNLGNGLYNMKKRMEEINGKFNINSTNKGTHLILEI